MVKVSNLRTSYYHGYRKTVEKPISDVKLYLEIVTGLMKFIMKKVFEGYDVQLSANDSLGRIGVRGVKTSGYIGKDGQIKGLAPHWTKTKELWDNNPQAKLDRTIVYCTNEHSGGVRYKLVWYKQDAKLPNKSLYTLKFCRKNKRTLNKLITVEQREYMVITK